MPSGIYKRKPHQGFKKGHIPWNKGKPFIQMIGNTNGFKKGGIAWNKDKKGTHFSKKTEFKKGQNSGIKNINWNGGYYKNSAGYVCILQPNHPFANKQGYVFEHRIVMEKHLGRYLKPIEIIHHFNKNVSDNRIKNLKLFIDNIHHLAFHRKLNAHSKLLV